MATSPAPPVRPKLVHAAESAELCDERGALNPELGTGRVQSLGLLARQDSRAYGSSVFATNAGKRALNAATEGATSGLRHIWLLAARGVPTPIPLQWLSQRAEI